MPPATNNDDDDEAMNDDDECCGDNLVCKRVGRCEMRACVRAPLPQLMADELSRCCRFVLVSL